MTDKLKVKARIARGDGSVAPHTGSCTKTENNGDYKPGCSGGKTVPHDRESQVTTSITGEDLICPCCGKPDIHAEFPDHYEAWIKCSSCGFFMGMSNEEWHRMESSPNINGTIKKMAILKELVTC